MYHPGVACKQLSDVACLEWVRFGETRLASETSEHVEAHLSSCEDCGKRVRGFEAMERAIQPYGSPPPADRRRVWFRRGVTLAAAAALGYVSWFMLF